MGGVSIQNTETTLSSEPIAFFILGTFSQSHGSCSWRARPFRFYNSATQIPAAGLLRNDVWQLSGFEMSY